jgi:hypothetical protein
MTTTNSQRRVDVLAFLESHGAGTTPHIFGDLQNHLIGVETLVRDWGGSDFLALAALTHATYGTDGFEPHILELAERSVLAGIVGSEVEALVYFYASCDRDHFYPQLEAPDTSLPDLTFRDRFTGGAVIPEAAEVKHFVNLTFANECELAASSPGGAAEWTWLADFCGRTARWASPSFATGAAALFKGDG